MPTQQIISKDEWRKTSRGVTVVIGTNDDCYVMVAPFGKKIEDRIWDHTNNLYDLDLRGVPNGIKVWEEDELLMETFRDPTDAEWECIKAGESPWKVGP